MAIPVGLITLALIVSGCGGTHRATRGAVSPVAVTPPGSRPGFSRAMVTEVPSHLPPDGVMLENPHMYMRPWASAPREAMSARAAIAAALVFANKAKSFPATALQAELSMPGKNAARYAKHHERVWVVTFTSPKPVNVCLEGRCYVTHYSVVVDAVTGKMVRGFFER